MAPFKGKAKGAPTKLKGKGPSKVTKSSSSSKSKKSAPIKTTQQKTKSVSHKPDKKKKRVYTDKELGIPTLNSIRPSGILKPKGTKKGKVFVDDKDGMLAILSMVQAEKEGDIESKMMRARHLEEIREAKRAEAEKREEQRRQRFEEVKDEVRRVKKDKKDKARRRSEADTVDEAVNKSSGKTKKRVSFG